MGFKYQIPYALDSPERTLYHGKIIRKKFFLQKLYRQWYAYFLESLHDLPNEVYVELGSGAGFLKELEPRFICTDILDLPGNDRTFSALEMPFEDRSVGGIFMIDSFHHFPDVAMFLKEVERVLAPGGQLVMIEPANSWWGRFIYRNFHHEPFEVRGGWQFPETGPLSGANGALPWIVFERDYDLFREKFPLLERVSVRWMNPLLYLLSGGVSYRQLLPDFTFPAVRFFDGLLPKISRELSMFQLIRVKKITG